MQNSMWDFNELVALEYQGGHTFRIVFDDGVAADVDLGEYVGRGPVFMPLQDPAFFRRAVIDGGTIAWPNEADIAPETLYEKTRRAMAAAGQRPHCAAKRDRAADKDAAKRAQNFTVVMERCNLSGRYVGHVPGFSGTRSQAGTPEELCAHLQKILAIRLQNGESGPDSEFVGTHRIAVAVELTEPPL